MPTATKTRRQKVQAMADQTASPAEAEVAKAMLANQPDRLTAIKEDIEAEWGKGIDAQFAVGHLLIEARSLFPEGDIPFGRWLAAQEFPFDRHMAYKLREAAAREPEVRAIIAGRSYARQAVSSIAATYDTMTRKPKPAPSFTMDEVSENHRTDSVFNRWQFATYNVLGRNVSDDDEATVTWADRPFEHLHVDDLVEAADLIKRLVTAYQTEKTARAASA